MRTLLALAFIALASRCFAEEPQVIPLWPDKPPQFLADALAETFENGTFHGVTIPSITLFAPPADKRNGMAIIVCAGGGYGGLAWKIHVEYAAQVFNPMGVTIIGLKYRLRPPHILDNAGIQALTLLDAKRAVRLVRHRASEWGIDPRTIGVAGYSAGANLSMNLAANFDEGYAASPDPIERLSSRPDFAVGLGTWHWRKPENPFVFKKNAPPVYLVHATTDKPVEIATTIVADLKQLGVPARLDMFEEGGHGVGNLIPARVQHGFPGAQWPKLLLDLAENPERPLMSLKHTFRLCIALLVVISPAFSQDAKKPNKISDAERQEFVDGLAKLQQSDAPWLAQTGKVIRGFRSRLDDSVQPYVINVPVSWRGPKDKVKGERRPPSRRAATSQSLMTLFSSTGCRQSQLRSAFFIPRANRSISPCPCAPRA